MLPVFFLRPEAALPVMRSAPSSWLGFRGREKRRVNAGARRAAKEAKEAPAQPAPEKVKVEVKKFVKIGRPGYKDRLSGNR
ncbi:hypothetical protein JRQ81_008727 [Phrynocephalus forsythii]|uniref:Uncharacterized protein n=1 Tax=Phrynocephalus forsythii TaxID=171643 RepID=A0A9Q0XDZ6_9SAUR|nr:hypothetical protein JRQ81_008727 [Phrynocephalus forsythii]